MNQKMNTPKYATDKELREQLKLQLAQYLEQQPESTLATHKWMKRLEVAGFGIIVAAFIFALIVSFRWASGPVAAIPAAWFLFAASAAPALVLVGVHTLILKASPPIILPGKPQRFVIGGKATGTGWVLILGGVVTAVFWGYFSYALWTSDVATMGAILGVVLGVGISVGIVITLITSTSRLSSDPGKGCSGQVELHRCIAHVLCALHLPRK